MWLETCLRDLDLPVLIFMYLAINSFLPGRDDDDDGGDDDDDGNDDDYDQMETET